MRDFCKPRNDQHLQSTRVAADHVAWVRSVNESLNVGHEYLKGMWDCFNTFTDQLWERVDEHIESRQLQHEQHQFDALRSCIRDSQEFCIATGGRLDQQVK